MAKPCSEAVLPFSLKDRKLGATLCRGRSPAFPGVTFAGVLLIHGNQIAAVPDKLQEPHGDRQIHPERAKPTTPARVCRPLAILQNRLENRMNQILTRAGMACNV